MEVADGLQAPSHHSVLPFGAHRIRGSVVHGVLAADLCDADLRGGSHRAHDWLPCL